MRESTQKQLLYLGNKLSRKGRNLSTVEVLSSQLETEGYKVISGSSQKNQVLRLLDMLLLILKHHSKSHLLLIDTYSTSAFWFAYLSAKLANQLKLNYIPILHGGDLPKRLASHPKHCRQLFEKAKVTGPELFIILNKLCKTCCGIITLISFSVGWFNSFLIIASRLPSIATISI